MYIYIIYLCVCFAYVCTYNMYFTYLHIDLCAPLRVFAPKQPVAVWNLHVLIEGHHHPLSSEAVPETEGRHAMSLTSGSLQWMMGITKNGGNKMGR